MRLHVCVHPYTFLLLCALLVWRRVVLDSGFLVRPPRLGFAPPASLIARSVLRVLLLRHGSSSVGGSEYGYAHTPVYTPT